MSQSSRMARSGFFARSGWRAGDIGGATLACTALAPCQCYEYDVEERVEANHAGDSSHDARSGGIADTFRAALNMQTFRAGDEADQQAEQQALQHARNHVL